ncbi:MAG: FtsK/SpoIIIE domain-containing protein, partial [Scrofimicrobium sp.]
KKTSAKEYEDAEMPVVLGITEDGNDLILDLADQAHYGIQGQTRSGKSVLTYVWLSRVSQEPTVRVVGCDPTGVLLGPFSEKLEPWIALGTKNMSDHAEALEAVVAEMDNRIASLGHLGLDKLPRSTVDKPKLFVVLEEFPGILNAASAEDSREARKPNERVKNRILAARSRLLNEGAKVNISVLTLAQRFDAEIGGGAERAQISYRFTLRVDNSDAVRMLHPNAGSEVAEQVALFKPGHGLVDRPGYPLSRFRGDYIDYQTYRSRVLGS